MATQVTPTSANGFPLRDCRIFKDLSEDDLARISTLCSELAIDQDAPLFTEGRDAPHLYVVTSGQVALQKSIRAPAGKAPRRTTVAICGPGDVVGWSAIVPPHKYTHSAVSWGETILLKIDGVTLRRALDTHPDLGVKIMKAMAETISSRLDQTTSALITERETMARYTP